MTNLSKCTKNTVYLKVHKGKCTNSKHEGNCTLYLAPDGGAGTVVHVAPDACLARDIFTNIYNI